MEETTARALFYLLKKEVEKRYLSNTPSLKKQIHDWSVNEIRDFQEAIANELNERVSERWFYTHLKPVENEKLPRVDMLNILSRYVGYLSWDDFVAKQGKNAKSIAKPNRSKIILIAGVVSIILLVFIAFRLTGSDAADPQYEFCFIDKDSGLPLQDSTVELTIINSGESPMRFSSDKTGCVKVDGRQEFIRFTVKAPYYKTDTIERKLGQTGSSETIELRKDDYALMILFFATADLDDWEKRRNQLDGMISDKAVIFQIAPDHTGMEMYNKTDFIDKLTTPLKSLGEIEIVETIYENDKIVNLRFIQKAEI